MYLPYRTASLELPWRHVIRKWLTPASLSGFTSNRGLTYSRINYKKRKSADEQKTVSESEKKLKNKIKILRVTDIWKNMTVQELADSLQKDIGMDALNDKSTNYKKNIHPTN